MSISTPPPPPPLATEVRKEWADWFSSVYLALTSSNTGSVSSSITVVQDALTAHVTDFANPHHVTKAQVLSGNLIIDTDVAVAAAIARNKLAPGTANSVVVNDANGIFSSVSMLSITNGGTGSSLAGLTAEDLVLGASGTALKRLAKGMNGQLLSVSAGLLSWQDASALAPTITLTGNVTGSGTTSIATTIAAGVITNGMVNSSAAIAGTKISPDFGSQNIVTTGTLSSGNASVGVLTASTASSGLLVTHDFKNTSNTTSSRNAIRSLCGGTSASEAIFSVGRTDVGSLWSFGYQVSSGSFIISTGANLNTSCLTIDSSGNVTLGVSSSSTITAAGTFGATNFSGTSSGTNTGDQTSVSGNAGTATKLQTARTINGVSFDGSANITVTAGAGTLTGTTLNSTVVSSSLTSVGTLASLTVTATIAGSVNGNAATATALQNARTINGTSFDGTANITVTAAASTLTGTTLNSTVTASSLTSVGTLASLAVTGGSDLTELTVKGNGTQTSDLVQFLKSDNTVLFKITNAGNGTFNGTLAASNLSGTNTGDQTTVSGNAGTATTLQTARNINSVSFNGSADITVTAAAGTLTGTTLNATVVTSSLTSVGTLTSLTVTGQLKGGGTTTNDNAGVGIIGEVFRAYQASLVSISTSATYQNVTSISLTAGDWDVSGAVSFALNTSATPTQMNAVISVNTGNTTTDHVEGDNWINSTGFPTSLTDSTIAIATYRISLSGNTTVFLKGAMTFASGTPKFLGRLSARRAR